MSCFVVGQRVQDLDGFKATARYVGPVAASKNKTETWVGVEWDDKTRGKHDGSCVDSQGVFHRYFECEMGAGSFIKPVKLKQPYSFYDALADRYVAMEAEKITSADNVLPDMFVSTSSGAQKSIEFVGEMKIRKWQQIDVVNKVTMRTAGISHVGEDSSAAAAADGVGRAAHIEEMDLQDNLLWQWTEIARLCHQTPPLTSLQLHGNKMQPLTDEVAEELRAVHERHVAGTVPAVSSTTCFSQLRILALHRCDITSWASVVHLSALVPNIEELYLSSNKLSDLGGAWRRSSSAAAADSHVFSKVTEAAAAAPVRQMHILRHCTVLDISHCGITSWTDILSALTSTGASGGADPSDLCPSLTDLLVDGNPIECITTSISASSAGSSTAALATDGRCVMPKLQRLSASSTKLASWHDIDVLGNAVFYPALKNLRVTHVPLFAGKGVSEIRPVVIGRLARLQFFNGSAISARERGDSEKSYLRRIKREIAVLEQQQQERQQDGVEESKSSAAPATDAAAAAAHARAELIEKSIVPVHPRYAELEARFGAELLPMDGPGSGLGNATIGEDLVEITLHNLCLSGGANMKSGEPITRKLPGTIQVGNLKQLVKSLFRIDALPTHLIQLAFRAYKDNNTPPTFLDDDTNALLYYGVPIGGGDIYINEAKEKK